MGNRFGLEDIGNCANCGAECIGAEPCPDCAEPRYAAAERELEAAEDDAFAAALLGR